MFIVLDNLFKNNSSLSWTFNLFESIIIQLIVMPWPKNKQQSTEFSHWPSLLTFNKLKDYHGFILELAVSEL